MLDWQGVFQLTATMHTKYMQPPPCIQLTAAMQTTGSRNNDKEMCVKTGTFQFGHTLTHLSSII